MFLKIYQLLLTIRTENKELKGAVELLSNKIDKKIENELVELGDFKTEIIYNNKNLLDIHASCMSKYVTKLMEIMFTPEERNVGYIMTEGSKSKRTPLDQTKIQILKGITYIVTVY